ncbi:Hypothetical predicted protein [Olea europaea subsp. europaea]|uniref:Uncharacterized protein n=1 Tax=Olea europaea subsp. europaea TaxID=158383 RepID=A0A8S0U5P3_OLEEU|nr:Hypothetical predicted protein [Olea europaea subsp. europaea]
MGPTHPFVQFELRSLLDEAAVEESLGWSLNETQTSDGAYSQYWSGVHLQNGIYCCFRRLVGEKDEGPNVPYAQTLMNKMLSTGQLHKKTDMYFWTLSFLLLRRNREILAMQEDANDKLDWVEWSWLEHRKAHPK